MEEALLGNMLAAPALQRELFEPEALAVLAREFEK
jgi:hypothetical protein